MDLFDRRIIGWALSVGLETRRPTVPALTVAFTNHPAQEGLLFHSGLGVQ
jgi:transposase InsO family protein